MLDKLLEVILSHLEGNPSMDYYIDRIKDITQKKVFRTNKTEKFKQQFNRNDIKVSYYSTNEFKKFQST